MGMTRAALICWASLKPFTLDEMITVIPMPAMATAGERPKISRVHGRLGSSRAPNVP